MASRKDTHAAHNARTDATAKHLATRIAAWQRDVLRAIDRRGYSGVIRVPRDQQLKLIAILTEFGVRESERALNDVLPRGWVKDEVGQAKVQWFYQKTAEGALQRAGEIADTTAEMIRAEVRRTVADAMKSTVQPSAGGLARMIHTRLFETGENAPYAFSPVRAALIARTETAQAENTGVVAGYAVVAEKGDMLEWISYADGKSGDRHHERMDGKRIPIEAASGSDESKWFRLPDGTRMPYPGYYAAPIKQTANCRCTTRLVVVNERK